MGTNSSFKKDVLYEVGLFDRNIKYYLDETDVCVRVIKSGYKVKHIDDAIMCHEMIEGHNRKSSYDLNWTEIMKNVIYFTLKNFRSEFSSYTVRPVQSLFWWLKNFIPPYLNKDVSLKQLLGIYYQLIKGALKGYRYGLKVNGNSNIVVGMPAHSKKNLTVCFLSQEFAKECNGGVCRYTYDLAHTLAELGNEVHVITKSEKDRGYDYRDGKVFVHEIVPEQMDFLDLPEAMHISHKNLSYSYAACLKLLELVDTVGIQIVEAPLWDGEGFVFSLVNPIPLVIRLETPLFKVAEIQGWHITKDLKLVNWMEGETVKRADKAIAISNDIGTVISTHHTIPQERIELCPLGIEVPDESSLLRDRNKNGFDVLFVGRLEKRKGIETLFKAIPLVLKEVPDARFHIVGSDTNLAPNGGSYRDHLLQNMDKKYHKNVRFVGYVNDNELKDFYRNCDIFVAPSLYESFGLIYLEAMAWGKPVIGCDVGGVPEIVEDGETGILIPPEDENALAEAIINLKDEKLRAKMGEQARKKIKERYTREKMALNSSEIYREIVK
jgi:glycosyltransferase involved in cell wall biosynthesis